MYDVALAVAACLRAGTRADVAWLVDADGIPVTDWNRTVAFTPGGGRVGGIDGGPIDAKLADAVGLETPRLVAIEVSEVDAFVSGLDTTGTVSAIVAPASSLASEVWDAARDREPFCLVARIDDGAVESIGSVVDENAEPDVTELLRSGHPGPHQVGDSLVSVFRAAPRLVVVGDTPVADALERIGGMLGWQASVVHRASEASGVIASLSSKDKLVVAAHDLELAGAALLSGLESQVGYIGSMGSRRMQENRADWLAYRGVIDFSRIHGPAGLDIGAATPAEIAVAILAEAIATAQPVEPSEQPE